MQAIHGRKICFLKLVPKNSGYQNPYSPGQRFNTIDQNARALMVDQEIGNDRKPPAG